MSVITENNKDHLLNYEGVEQLLIKINERFVKRDRFAEPNKFGMIKAENSTISKNDVLDSSNLGINYPVQITTEGNAFVNINVPTGDSRPYAVCETARDNRTKQITIPDFTLVDGATIIVNFVNGFDGIRSTLQINNSTPITIYKDSTNALLQNINAVIMELKYDASLSNGAGGWIVLNTNALIQADWNEENSRSLAFIHNKPTSLPANGGNADTVDGKHASDFAVANHNHRVSVTGAFRPIITCSYSDGVLTITGGTTSVTCTGTTNTENAI